MKRSVVILICLLILGFIRAQTISFEELNRASQKLMKTKNPEAVLRGTDTLVSDENRPVGFVFRFAPAGFIITSASELTRPVYGYSFTGDFNFSGPESRKIKSIIIHDLQNRIRQTDRLPMTRKRAITQEWEQFLSGRLLMSPFQQWPPEGTTPSGGWITTNWTQSAPYNSMCPMDLNAGVRSVVGCPATAMAQILNYHETLNSISFNDGDDYYHSYGAGNQYWIDDDHVARSFPSWDSLNTWLSSMEYAYQIQAPISTEMKAALSFACGVAAHQVYTASVSGTFGIDQAWDSFQRFGFTDSRLIFPTDTNLNSDIAGNIKVALPVQLGLLVEPPGSGGHNVVVDGYNTDEFYHFNFGWGGSSNGWYTLPPTYIAYNLTIIEGAVLDIKSANYTDTPEDPATSASIHIYPNPASDHVFITTSLKEATITIYDLSGKPATVRARHASPIQDTRHTTKMNIDHLPAGLYIVQVIHNGNSIYQGKMIKE